MDSPSFGQEMTQRTLFSRLIRMAPVLALLAPGAAGFGLAQSIGDNDAARRVPTIEANLMPLDRGIGQWTKLDIPRFASLRSGQVNVRRGPGTVHDVEWQFRLSGLPVEIIAETEEWRLIRDYEGATGWVQRSLLTSKRYGFVVEDKAPLYRSATDRRWKIARAQRGTLGRIKACTPDMCRVTFKEITGWVEKKALWGIYWDEEWR